MLCFGGVQIQNFGPHSTLTKNVDNKCVDDEDIEHEVPLQLDLNKAPLGQDETPLIDLNESPIDNEEEQNIEPHTPEYIEVTLGSYYHLDSIHLNPIIVWEGKLEPRPPLYFPLIVMMQLGLSLSI